MVRVSRLKEVLLERDISKVKLAIDLDIPTVEIEYYFKNIEDIPLTRLVEIANYLKCTPSDLYEEYNSNTQDSKQNITNTVETNKFANFLKNSFIPKTMVMNNQYLYIFMLFVVLLMITTDIQLNTWIELYQKNVFMIFAYRWTFIAVFLGLLLPLLFTSFWSYLLLFNGIKNIIFLLETIYLKEYGPTISSNTMYIVVTIVSIVLCIIYAIIVNHLRRKVGILNIKNTLKGVGLSN